MGRTLITTFLKRQAISTAIAAAMLSASLVAHADETLNKVVAVVDSYVILESDLDQAIVAAKQQLAQQHQNIPSDTALRSEMLRQLILRDAQLERVKRAGITIDDDSLNAAMADVARQNGAKSLAEFQSRLDAHSPGAYATLRRQVTDDLSINRLRQQQVSARIKVSEQDIDNFLNSPESANLMATEDHIIHIRVPYPSSASVKQIEQAQLIATKIQKELQGSNDYLKIVTTNKSKAYRVDGVDMGWKNTAEMPPQLAAQLEEMKPGQVSDPIRAADGIHVLKLLGHRNTEQQVVIDQYKVRHILIRPNQVVTPEDAHQKIDEIYKRIQRGADFAEEAATFSNDPGSAANGGDLSWVSPGVMVPEFETVMKSTPVGEVSKPFETQFGWHILEVEDTRKQDVTKESKRNAARQILAERQFNQELDGWLREVRTQSYVEIKDGTPVTN